MKVIQTIKAGMDRFGEYWSLLIVLIVLFPALESVLFRSLLNKPTIWSAELSTMLFGAYFIIGGAYCEGRGAHVSMDVFYSNMKGPLKMFVDTLTLICCLIVCGALLYFGWNNTMQTIAAMERTESLWRPVIWPSRITIPIGMLLMIVRSFITYIEKMQAEIVRMKGGGE